MERESLYAAICANPRDDLPKLVFADWLDEHGDAVDRAHAELIRIQCEWETDAMTSERAVEPYRIEEDGDLLLASAKLAKSDPEAAHALALLIRAAELENVAKTRPLVELPVVPGASFRFAGRISGMRTELQITRRRAWEEHLAQIAKLIPMRELDINPARYNGDGAWPSDTGDPVTLGNIESLTSTTNEISFLNHLIASPELNRLKRLTTLQNPAETDLYTILERSDHLGELEELVLSRHHAPQARSVPAFHPNIVRNLRGLRVGAKSGNYPGLPLILPFSDGSGSRLEELLLRYTSDTDDSAGILGRGEVAGSTLVKLALPNGQLTARGACDLLASESLPALRQLDVSGNALGDLVGKRLQRARDYPELHALALGDAQLSTDGISALAHWPGFAGLRKLVLDGNPLNHRAAAALSSVEAPNLRALGLANCELHGSHVRELVTSRFVRSLWTLDLRGNAFDDAFARALLDTPMLDGLQCLLLDVPEGNPMAERLKAHFGDRFRPSA